MRLAPEFGGNRLFHKSAQPFAALAALAAIGISLAATAGCSADRVPTVEEPSRNSSIPIDELLDYVAGAYRGGHRYEDRATIELSYRDGDQRVSDKADISVSFVRPNRLTLRAYKTVVHCDGERFQARVRDEGTRDLDGQIVDRPAPERLTLNDLTSDVTLVQQLSNAVLDSELGRLPPQLELLLGDKPWSLLSDPTHARKIVGEESLGGTNCLHLEVETPVGIHHLWIDPAYYIIRKIEFPREALLPELAHAEHLKDVKLTAEFHGAVIDYPGNIGRRRSPIPEGGRRVRYFVPPPQPLPSELFGKPAGEFSFQSLDGNPLARQSLQGKPAVLLWFHEHPACQAALQQLEIVFQKTQSVAIYGVCTEPSEVETSHIESFVRDWNISLPIVRDLAAHGRDLFHFQGSPALLVLNADGIVQIVEIGANPQLAEELTTILERLEKGEDIAADVLAKEALERRRYERALAIAAGEVAPEPTAVASQEKPPAPTSATPFAPVARPKRFKADQRWTVKNIESPGRLIAVPASTGGGGPRLFVLDGGRSLTELSPSGKELSKRRLSLPEGVEAVRLRYWSQGGDEARWAVSSRLPPRIFVLDEQGNLVAEPTLPVDARAGSTESAAEAPHLEWLDLDGDKRPELAVRRAGAADAATPLDWFDSQGRPLGLAANWPREARWLAAAPPPPGGAAKANWNLWYGDASGRANRWTASGRVEPLEEQGEWRLNQVFAAGFPPESASKAAGIAANNMGRAAFVAFDDRFRQTWNYPLPASPNQSSIDPIQAALLFVEREPFWVLAAADGTVHLISADGSSSDYFSLGEAITGLATLRYDGNSLIVVATAREVSAWSFEGP